MGEIEGVQEPSEGIDVGHQVDRHREIAGEWLAAAIAGIREMHLDELARRRSRSGCSDSRRFAPGRKPYPARLCGPKYPGIWPIDSGRVTKGGCAASCVLAHPRCGRATRRSHPTASARARGEALWSARP